MGSTLTELWTQALGNAPGAKAAAKATAGAAAAGETRTHGGREARAAATAGETKAGAATAGGEAGANEEEAAAGARRAEAPAEAGHVSTRTSDRDAMHDPQTSGDSTTNLPEEILASRVACLRLKASLDLRPRCAFAIDLSAGGRAPRECTYTRSDWASGAAVKRENVAHEPFSARPRTSYRSRCSNSPAKLPRESPEGCVKA